MIIDSHIHLFPDKFFDAIWKWFDTYAWKIQSKMYRDECIDHLKKNGIDYAVSYNYAHKPGISSYLNEWNYESKNMYSNIIAFAAIHPDDENINNELNKAFRTYQLSGIKIHCHVIGISPDDERLFPIYEKIIENGKILTIHSGSGPNLKGYSKLTETICSTDRMRRVLKRFPDMKCIVPHLGAEDFEGFFNLMSEFENLWTDTTMVLSNYFTNAPSIEQIIKFQDRILYGSDFPNIPYEITKEIENIKLLNLGKEIEDKIFFKNAQRFFGQYF